MKVFVCLLVLVGVVACQEQYTDKYDNFDINQVLQSKRLLENYVDCVTIDTAHCTPEGAELKRHIKDALQTGCSKCNAKQKERVKEVARFLKKNRPDLWQRCVDKYDPNGEYISKYSDLIEGL